MEKIDWNNYLNRDIVCSCGKTHFCDIEEIVIEDHAIQQLPGILAKHDYGMITRGVSKKTKIKNGQASYRHKGAYGPEKVYTRHDQREMDRILE